MDFTALAQVLFRNALTAQSSANLLTNSEPAFAFSDQGEIITAIGRMPSPLAEKADSVLSDYAPKE